MLKDRMGFKMTNFNIIRLHQFLAEGGHKKTIYRQNCLKRGASINLQRPWQKREKRMFLRGIDTPMHTMTYFWYMPELEIGLAHVSELNFDQYLLQFNEKKKINANSSCRFEWKC